MITGRPLKIAIGTIVYSNLTGVELYIYELARELLARGNEVMILAPEVGGEIKKKSEEMGAKVFSFENCPDDFTPDILHLNEYLPSAFLLSRWLDVPAVATIHSEYGVEKPFVSRRIHKYICIRESIQQVLVEKYGIQKDSTEVVFNGINFSRFKPTTYPGERKILFVGTIDPLREKSIKDLIEYTRKERIPLRIVGKRYASYLDKVPAHVEVLPPTWNIERYMGDVTETAGVLLGRTTIEGWAHGLSGWIYDIDLEGNIKGKQLHRPPSDLKKFDSRITTEAIWGLYQAAIDAKKDLVTPGSQMEDLARIVSTLVERSTIQGMGMYNINQTTTRLEEDVAAVRRQVVEVIDNHSRMTLTPKRAVTFIKRKVRGEK